MPGKDHVAQPSSAVRAAVHAWIAADPKSLHLLEQARKIAAGTSTVLISGESGVGKDLLASLLHYLGPHAQEPLVKIDCASLPHELVESELFGYEKGAFTGATATKRGRLELAGAGTIVLDEVAAVPLAVQAKLLRALEEKRFHRLGGTRTVEVAARIIALTNADLAEAVARGAFREDLYYRLNVLPLSVPPLRERPADIRPLARRLLSQLVEGHRGPARSLATDALAALERYPFPGNVRELRNILERALVSSSAPEISLDALPAHVRQAAHGRDRHKMTLEEMERAYIAEILDFTRGKKSKAAAILGISRKTLLEKRKRYGLD
jgi:two-component system response regulator AtoC